MDPVHRRIIADNELSLSRLINLELTMPHLVPLGLFTQEMYDDLKDLPPEKCRFELIKDLPTRGPDAFKKFVDILVRTGQTDAARLLGYDPHQATVTTEQPEERIPPSYPRSTLQIDSSGEPPILNPIKRTIRVFQGDGIYKMSANPRGMCLLINNRNFRRDSGYSVREATEQDAYRIKSVFTDLHFIVDEKQDLTGDDMADTLEGFAKRANHSQMDAAVVVILSHGEKENIVGTDGKLLSIKNIIRYFYNEPFKAPTLQNKPKLFFIQACRGNVMDYGTNLYEHGSLVTDAKVDAKTDSPQKIPTVSDIMVSYSCIEDFTATRHTLEGSWYIKYLTTTLREHAHEWELTDLLKETNSRLSQERGCDGRLSAGEFRNISFNKKFYFNPGYFRS